MSLQNSDPAKQVIETEEQRYIDEMMLREEGVASTNFAPTSTCVADDDYMQRVINGELTSGEHNAVYESMFPMKRTDGGVFVLNDKDSTFDYVYMANHLIDYLDMRVFVSREKPSMPKRVVVRADGRYVNAVAVIPTVVNYLSKKVAKESTVNSVVYSISNDVGIRTYFEEMSTNPRRANFVNGVVDISGDDVVFVSHDKDDVFFTRVPHDYPVGGGECPVFQAFLDYALDPKYHQFIYEWIGYCFFETYEFQNIVFHHGVGGSGKSTLFKLISAVLGPSNVSGISLKQCAHEKFSLNLLDGAMANHGSEVSYRDLKDGAEILKQLSSGVDPVLVEQKYEKAYPIINTAKLSYAMNDLPKTFRDDTGLWRRLILVEWLEPMEPSVGRRFNSSDVGMFTPDEINGVISKSIQAFHAMTKRGEFSYAPMPTDVRGEYDTKSDSIGSFIHDCIEFSDVHANGYRDGEGDWEATVDIYNTYVAWCAYKDAKPVDPGTFNNRTGLAEEMGRTLAIRERRKHDGKYNVRGWKHIKLVSGHDSTQIRL